MSHNGSVLPTRDGRYLYVQAFYQGGNSYYDFTNPAAPQELGFADLEDGLGKADSWSTYWYNGTVFVNGGLNRRGATANRGFEAYSIDAEARERSRQEVGLVEPADPGGVPDAERRIAQATGGGAEPPPASRARFARAAIRLNCRERGRRRRRSLPGRGGWRAGLRDAGAAPIAPSRRPASTAERRSPSQLGRRRVRGRRATGRWPGGAVRARDPEAASRVPRRRARGAPGKETAAVPGEAASGPASSGPSAPGRTSTYSVSAASSGTSGGPARAGAGPASSAPRTQIDALSYLRCAAMRSR